MFHVEVKNIKIKFFKRNKIKTHLGFPPKPKRCKLYEKYKMVEIKGLQNRLHANTKGMLVQYINDRNNKP